MKAKTKEQYISTWRSHVNELIHPFCDSDCPIDDWEDTKAQLYEVISQAAAATFPVSTSFNNILAAVEKHQPAKVEQFESIGIIKAKFKDHSAAQSAYFDAIQFSRVDAVCVDGRLTVYLDE